ncbi:MAG TPA: alkyl hydroperoxide reductase subunit F [Burkholderiaceae bacterium]|nr:alkyl hydroperoxide reductase subunit F [Burkholderiaceae bacterium]
MLDNDLKAQLKAYLEKLTEPIQLIAHLDDGEKSTELKQLLQDIQSLSDKVSLEESSEAAERTPSFFITRPGTDIRVGFAGLPMGHEFTSLVLALLQVGGHPVKLDDSLIEQIKNLDGDYAFETFFSLSCQNCPDVVQALNTMAVINPRIQPMAIDGALFPEEVEAKQIMSVPAVFLNGDLFTQGRCGVEEILAQLDSGSGERKAEELNAKEEFDVLIVGGGPAGAAAAIYAARKGIRTGLVADRFGGQVLDTLSIENYISVIHTTGPEYANALEAHVKEYDVDIMNLQLAQELLAGKPNRIRLANGAELKAKTLVLAPGARWREINVPGELEYRNRGVAYCPHCDGPLYKGKPVAVIGGGNSGVEAAIDLAGLVKHVTLIEFSDQLRADDVLQRKLKSLPNVDIILSAETTEILGDGNKVTGLAYNDRKSGDSHELQLEGVFIQIGLVPNTEWLKGAIELSEHGEIVIDDKGATSLPGVFAAGDATTVPYKQIVIAAGQGAQAALSAFDHLIRSSVEEDEPAKAAVSA